LFYASTNAELDSKRAWPWRKLYDAMEQEDEDAIDLADDE